MRLMPNQFTFILKSARYINIMEKNNHKTYRPTWAEVNLNNLAYNFYQVKKITRPSVKIMVCVKADAYGHGIIPVSKRLESLGVDYLGVASIDEGILLRKAGIKKPMLILGLVLKKDIEPVYKYKLTPTICTQELALAFNAEALRRGKVLNVHIKVDTGMGRVGVLYKDSLDFIKKVSSLKALKIEGVFTHLSCADTDKVFTQSQIRIFNKLIDDIKKTGIKIPLVHAANSMGIIGYKDSHFNMVRPGLIIYGLYPKPGLKIKLKPVLSLKTKVIFTKKLPKGHGVSYGRTYITKNTSYILTLPIGYGDGYPRNLSNLAPVLIKGKRFKISG
ncbi:alanine racemase, partial [bacterium]